MEEVYTNCYGSLSVYKNKNDALKFYNECYLLSEGAERERYASILFALNNNESIAYDNFSNTCGEIYLHTNNYFERPLKIDLDSMLSFKDCIKYYKDSLKPLLEVCNEFEINFNNNSPFEEFGADNEFNMRSITDFYIELLKKMGTIFFTGVTGAIGMNFFLTPANILSAGMNGLSQITVELAQSQLNLSLSMGALIFLYNILLSFI